MRFNMNTFTQLLLVTGLGFSGAALANNPVPGAPQSQPVLLTNATVFTVAQGTKADTDVLLTDGKISAIGTDLPVPANAQVVDLTGKHLYPGLIALANQLGLIEIEAVRATDDTRETTATNPDVRAQIAFDTDSKVIPTLRSNGVSYSLIYPDGRLLMGQSALMQLDGWNWEDATVRAGVALHIRWPNASIKPSPYGKPEKPEELAKANAEKLDELYQQMDKAKAYQLAKQAGQISQLDSRWEAMLPVFAGERPVFVHADDARQIRQALQFARHYQLKLTIVGGLDSWQLADELAKAKVPVIFTAPFGIPERDDEAVDTAYATPALLAKAGVQFAIGIQGFWQVRDLPFGAGQAASFGLDKDAALASITLNAAKIAGVDDKLGSIEVGKAATLVVSDGDILDYRSSKIRQMWIDGRAVDLDTHHKELDRKYRQRLSR